MKLRNSLTEQFVPIILKRKKKSIRRGRLRPAAACGSGYDGHKKGCPYRATGHNKENKGLVSSRLLIGRVEMETDREVARRKPLAAGLAACLYRGTDGR